MSLALLDTDILSEVIKLRDPIVQQHAIDYTQQHGPIAFSAIARYEVIRGYKQQGATKQLARFAIFCANSHRSGPSHRQVSSNSAPTELIVWLT